MVKLTWSKVPGADGYKVYIKVPGSKKFRLAVTKSRKVKGVTNRGLLKGKKYSYKIRAFKKVGSRKVYSKYSKVMTVKVKN
jgi:fibronectin type 3 domain-containing protein